MEEVWRDLNLDHNGGSNPADYRRFIFQDFLARSPYDSPSSQDISSSSLSPSSPLVTALSLGSSAPPFRFVDPLPQPAAHSLPPVLSSFPPPPSNLFPSSPSVSAFPHKRPLPESDLTDPNHPHHYNHGDGSGSERHKRMIKNRESAARSRARKQAYTNELEQKVDYLNKENERLRKQQQEWSKASASEKKKNPLFRTSTAPF
ncbi:protein FD isoform X2 [Prosopis cineraria]|uniref:protein FD isoform X2 n=1 Tax=Prosopis cineraria TaxID=364024 RepID=UPI0024105377|nr:protein FD isoform X2 [Prosopis cineraria]